MDFLVIVLRGAMASGISTTLDALQTVNQIAKHQGLAPIKWRVCSADGGTISLSSGLSVETEKLSNRPSEIKATWIVSGLALASIEAIERRRRDADFERVARLLAKHAIAKGGIAASCSAVFLLQHANLLVGRRATTTWWLAPYLKSLCPDCEVDANQMLCEDGPIVTAGAAFAQADLMLHVLRRRMGSNVSERLTRLLLVETRPAQAPFIEHDLLSRGDRFVQQVSSKIEGTLPRIVSIEQLAQSLGVSSRTLARRIQRVTGKSTVAFVQAIRLGKAKTLLTQTDLSVDQVAEAVGYQDSTALRRLMKRSFGVSPSSFRAVR